MQILLFKLPKAFTLLNFQKSVGRVPWQTNNTLIGISYLQNCINMLQFAPVCQAAEVSVILQKIGQMANPGKVWQILAVNRSQNVVFYRVKNYSHPGLQERGCICPPRLKTKRVWSFMSKPVLYIDPKVGISKISSGILGIPSLFGRGSLPAFSGSGRHKECIFPTTDSSHSRRDSSYIPGIPPCS